MGAVGPCVVGASVGAGVGAHLSATQLSHASPWMKLLQHAMQTPGALHAPFASGLHLDTSVGAADGSRHVDLWRGMRNLRMSDGFLRQGGTELAPMSTTTSLEVAATYSLGKTALLLKLHTSSFMERGADISYLSAFPAEKEVCFPPLTYLRPTGREHKLQCGTTEFNVVEVVPVAGT